MVSIHNTREFHNYTYNFEEDVFKVNKETILSYLQNNEPIIYNNIINNDKLKHKLNSPYQYFTIFIPVNMNDSYDLLTHLYESPITLENFNKMIVNTSKNLQTFTNNQRYHTYDIIIPNISVLNGMIHLIKI